MWLIITFIAALTASIAWMKIKNKKFKLGFLALMLWGTFIMVLVDHSIAFLGEGSPFIEFSTDGLISNAGLLGIAMLVPVFIVWLAAVFTPLGKKICFN
ncbi:MAG: hypothetical protein ABIJ74_01915 [archaeon]